MKAIKLNVTGLINSFRVMDFHTYQKTHLFPPKTTIIGMIGSAMGIPPEEANELTTRLQLAVVMKALGGEAKDLWKYLKYKSKPVPIRAVLVRELLYKPRYSIYLKSADGTLLDQVVEKLHAPEWALSLGREDELIKLNSIEEVELECKDKLSYNNTVLPFDITQSGYSVDPNFIKGNLLRERTRIVPPTVCRLPVRFEYTKKGRRPVEFKEFTTIFNLQVTPDQNAGGYADGDDHFQFF